MLTPQTIRLIEMALEEDLGRGDATSDAIFDPTAPARGAIVAKQPLSLAGLDVAIEVFRRVDPRIQVRPHQRDGSRVERMAVVAEVVGPARGVLGAERTALNFLQRLSGIATITRRFV